MDIKKSLKNIPATPGVYLFYDKKGKIIYVGKASNLSKRVRGYFSRLHPTANNAWRDPEESLKKYLHSGQKKYPGPRIQLMMSSINGVDYIPTSSSAEALIYEASLIKEKKPKYNIALKDDKSYPHLKLSVNEAYPRLLITRRLKRDGSLYYGPYTNVKLLRKAVSMMKRIFPLRICNKIPKKPCLSYHLGQCLGPCINKNVDSSYRDVVEDIKLFLKGRKKKLIKRLSERMERFSKKVQYEKALKIRNQIEALSVVIDQGKALLPIKNILLELKDALGLKHIPARIEAFDISNIHGHGAVGSMVTFFSGEPLKSQYRRFRIKTVAEIDDYAMIKEVVKRRCSRLLKEKKNLPDLILIDGGRGHLRCARDELKNLGLKIPIISIAKKPERIFVKERKTPIQLSTRSKAFKLIQRIRDEAHRFALSYHRIIRKKAIFNK